MPNHHTLFVREMPRDGNLYADREHEAPIVWGVYDEFGHCYGCASEKSALYQWAADNDVQFATIH